MKEYYDFLCLIILNIKKYNSVTKEIVYKLFNFK